MDEMKIYPTLPSAPDGARYQEQYHINTVQSEQKELIALKNRYKEKQKKYRKLLDRLMLAIAGSSFFGIGAGIGGAVTGVTIVGIPLSVGLGSVTLVSAVVNGVVSVFIKKYQKKLWKVEEIQDLITQGTAVFETKTSQSLNNDTMIDENEFKLLQSLYFRVLRGISEIDRKREGENRSKFEKNLLEEVNNIKKKLNADSS